MPNLTKHQRRVLRAIADATHPPYPPTLEEVRAAGGWRSRGAALYHLPKLVDLRLVEHRPGRQGVVLTPAGQREARRAIP